jgi:GNAT superfamily N-acetyltransferase
MCSLALQLVQGGRQVAYPFPGRVVERLQWPRNYPLCARKAGQLCHPSMLFRCEVNNRGGHGCEARFLKVWPMYRIREVDGHDEEIADTLADLHRLTFFDGAAIPEFDWGHWWLAYFERMPVAFAGVVPSTRAYNAGYFSRVGVLKKHSGNGLQLRLMRALESRARHNGWSCIISDTTNNLASANNFIRAGYQLYQPQYPWAWPNTLYWRKSIL